MELLQKWSQWFSGIYQECRIFQKALKPLWVLRVTILPLSRCLIHVAGKPGLCPVS